MVCCCYCCWAEQIWTEQKSFFVYCFLIPCRKEANWSTRSEQLKFHSVGQSKTSYKQHTVLSQSVCVCDACMEVGTIFMKVYYMLTHTKQATLSQRGTSTSGFVCVLALCLSFILFFECLPIQKCGCVWMGDLARELYACGPMILRRSAWHAHIFFNAHYSYICIVLCSSGLPVLFFLIPFRALR